MSPENQIYQQLNRIEDKVDNNTQKTQDGFDKVNGRIKEIERWKAYQEGIDKGTQMGAIKTWGFWKKAGVIVGLAIGIMTLAAAFAKFAATILEVSS